ncbi:MAG TPA: hypothetical protein VJB62_01555, partial [Patescibacteria group bacterium]|nr:hypothetical protein [Patescibacteria group bacterium]
HFVGYAIAQGVEFSWIINTPPKVAASAADSVNYNGGHKVGEIVVSSKRIGANGYLVFLLRIGPHKVNYFPPYLFGAHF